ncbi:hypothetical protein NC99_34410 [Sunxiuqinia dokdonensis]|uniref:Uncharacterized protein n=1 Tax=Sunxiuqinia dokdonensis TaxID=1409788 RepID=A0A0L8V5N8_9BACT|nr:hypothetical protein NC99_34410 [Sunxiuqinia dokdonensis]
MTMAPRFFLCLVISISIQPHKITIADKNVLLQTIPKRNNCGSGSKGNL